MHYTTLCRLCRYCQELDFNRLFNYLGKTKPDDAPLSLRTILDANGIHDAVSALAAIDDCPEKVLFAVRCVRQSAQHLLTDQRSLDALDVAELYAIGQATGVELIIALDAALDAVRDSVRDAARCAAWGTAKAAEAAYAAAKTGDAAAQVAEDAAWASAKAAEAATRAAGDVVWASARGIAAWQDAWQAIEQDFKDIFCS